MNNADRLKLGKKVNKLFREPLFTSSKCPFCDYVGPLPTKSLHAHVKNMHKDKYINKYQKITDFFIKEFNL